MPLRGVQRVVVAFTPSVCRYFSTRDGVSRGSFVRLEKLRSSATGGRTLLDALSRKYAESDDSDSLASQNTRIGGNVKVQLVGVRKLQIQRGGIERLQEIALLDAQVSSVVRPEHIMEKTASRLLRHIQNIPVPASPCR